MKLNLTKDGKTLPLERDPGSHFYLEVHQGQADGHQVEIRRVYFDRSGMDDFRYQVTITAPDGKKHQAGFGHRSAQSALNEVARKLPDFGWTVSEEDEDTHVPF